MNKSSHLSDKDISQISTYQSGVAQASAHRIINRSISDFLFKYDLTAMQWFIIGHVYDSGKTGMTLGALGRILGTTLPYTTNTINLLESKGIIVKQAHATDSRSKVVTLHPDYHHTVEEIESQLREHLRGVLYGNDHISREELQSYISVLYKIIHA